MHLGKKDFRTMSLITKALFWILLIFVNNVQRLLGYKTHAHYVLEERMAKTPEKVIDFLNDLLEKANPLQKKNLKL